YGMPWRAPENLTNWSIFDKRISCHGNLPEISGDSRQSRTTTTRPGHDRDTIAPEWCKGWKPDTPFGYAALPCAALLA
ncbi:hypothetical protein, partial [Zoogloea sp.]|uniref:hypothetical protein n=1 Tax=Zoogloea sp. TaxID=49181 RepID=UPI0035B3EF1C